MKVFRTRGKQLRILHDRGLNVYPVMESYNILEKTNYYNLINGYKEPFLKSGVPAETYKENSSFKEIYSLYTFDRRIRNLYLNEVLKIEDRIKTTVAYQFSKAYGYKEKDYLDINNFNIPGQAEKTMYLYEFISKLMRSIWKKNDAQQYINHYKRKHGYVPLWVLVNSMSFGELNRFYSYLKDADKFNIVKDLSINKTIGIAELRNYLSMINVYRNILAHDERFFCFKKKRSDGQFFRINFSQYLNIHTIDSSVFSLTLSLRILLDKEDFNIFLDNLLKEFYILESSLKTIEIEKILKDMNFIYPRSSINSLEDVEKILKYPEL